MSSQHITRKVEVLENLSSSASLSLALSPSSTTSAQNRLRTLTVSVSAGLDLPALFELLHPFRGKLSLKIVEQLLSEQLNFEQNISRRPSSSAASRPLLVVEADLQRLSKLHNFASKSAGDLGGLAYSLFEKGSSSFDNLQFIFRLACRKSAADILSPFIPKDFSRLDPEDLFSFDANTRPPLPPIVSSLQSLLYRGLVDVQFLAIFCHDTILALLLVSLFEAGEGAEGGQDDRNQVMKRGDCDSILHALLAANTRAVKSVVNGAFLEVTPTSNSSSASSSKLPLERKFLIGLLLCRQHCGTPPLIEFLQRSTRANSRESAASKAKIADWILACKNNKLFKRIAAGEDALEKQRNLELRVVQFADTHVVLSFFARVCKEASGRRLGQGGADAEKFRGFLPPGGTEVLKEALLLACADLSKKLLLQQLEGEDAVVGAIGERRSYVDKLTASRLPGLACGEVEPHSFSESALLLEHFAAMEHRRIGKMHGLAHEILTGRIRIGGFNSDDEELKMFDAAQYHSWKSVFFGKASRPDREAFVATIVTWLSRLESTGEISVQRAAFVSIVKSKLVLPLIKWNWEASSHSSLPSPSVLSQSNKRYHRAIKCVELLCRLISRPDLVPSVLDQSIILYSLYDIALSEFRAFERPYDLDGDEYLDGDELEKKDATTRKIKVPKNSPYDGVARGLAPTLFDSNSCMKVLTNALILMYSRSQSVEGQDVDADGFDKFTLRLYAQRLLLALVHHPNPKFGKDQVAEWIKIEDGRELKAFLAAVCDNIVGTWTFSGLDTIKEASENERNPHTLAGIVKQAQPRMLESKQSLLFLDKLLKNDIRLVRFVKGPKCGVVLRKKIAVCITKMLEKFLTLKSEAAATDPVCCEDKFWREARIEGSSRYFATCITSLMNLLFPGDTGVVNSVVILAARSCAFDLGFVLTPSPFNASSPGLHERAEEVLSPSSSLFNASPGFQELAKEVRKLHLEDALNESERLKLRDRARRSLSVEADGVLDTNLEAAYARCMREFMSIEEVKLLPDFKFAKKAAESASLIGAGKTSFREWRHFFKTIPPPHPNGSFFVRILETDYRCARASLSCPDSSPYAFGMFLFDIFLPDGYPGIPPIVELLTTGNGTTMMSPNLYTDGKTCLSLLNNTSSSSSEQKWIPGESSVYQVLISIQALLLVNEPGKLMGLDNVASDLYSKDKRIDTLKWAIADNLKNPVAGFELIIQSHFLLLRNVIRAKAFKWEEEESRIVEKRQLVRAINEVLAELDKLGCDGEEGKVAREDGDGGEGKVAWGESDGGR